MSFTYTKEDHCPNPYCNSTRIEWDTITFIEFKELYYPGTCQDCGCEFKEYHTIKYKETIINGND